MRAAHLGHRGGLSAAHVAGIRAAIGGGVGIQDFLVEAGLRDADAISWANDRSCVEHDDEQVLRILAAAHEREDAVVGIVAVKPLKPVPLEIYFVEGRLSGVELVQVGDQALDTAVRIMLEQVPVEAASFTEFAALAKLLAHE